MRAAGALRIAAQNSTASSGGVGVAKARRLVTIRTTADSTSSLTPTDSPPFNADSSHARTGP
jgi:outer membrane protein TolC